MSAPAFVRQAESTRESRFAELSAHEQATNPEFATSVNFGLRQAWAKRFLNLAPDPGALLLAPREPPFNLKAIRQPKLVLQSREQTHQFPLVLP
jgi:hypothetical protein